MADNAVIEARGRAASIVGADGGKSPCPDCVKKGLAILPVVSMLLHNSIRPVTVLQSLPQNGLNRALASLDSGLTSGDMKHHWEVMRALPAGYLYVLDLPKKSWMSYAVDAAGQLRSMAPASLPPEPQAVAPCSRSEHNPSALQTFVLDPERTPEVWVAYSRYRWTDKVKQGFVDDADRRSGRMSLLNVTYAASTGGLGGSSAIPNSMRMVDNIGDYVADYADAEVHAAINPHLIEPLHSRGARFAAPMLVPIDQGKLLADEMRRISVATERKHGIVLLLDDVVGKTAQLNFMRNRKAAEIAEVSGMGDMERSRRRVVAEVIEGLRASAEANPGPWWNKRYGPERYLRHIDQAKWQEALAESEMAKALMSVAEQISEDYVQLKESPRWKAVQRHDFDPHDRLSALQHEEMVAGCVAGSGLCKREREEIWDKVLALADTDIDNWLSRALAAQNEGVQALMDKAPPDFGQSLDAVKNAKSLAAELLVGNDGRMGAIEVVNNLRRQIRVDRAANAATSVLIETASNVMGRMLESNPERYHRLLRRITIAGLVRDDLVPQPVVVRGTWERIREWIMEVMTGPVQVDPRAAVSVGPMLSGMDYMRTRGNLGRTGWSLSQSVNGAVLYAAPGSHAETASVVFWIVNRAEAGVTFDAAAMRAFGLSEIDTTIPSRVLPDNPVLRNHLNRISVRADGMLSSVALLFQAHGFYGALVKFKQGKGDVGDGVKLFSSVLAASGAGLELVVAAQALRSAQATAGRIVLMKMAAKLGMWAGIADGAYSIIQGWGKLKEGDRDSGLWALSSGAAAIASTVAGFGLAAAGISAAAGGAASATVLGITLGPVGWVLLAIAFLGLAIYCAIQAFGTDDSELSPVEYWLDNGVFGKRARISGDHLEKNPFVDREGKAVLPFSSVNDELYQMQRITLVAQAMFNTMRSARAGAEVSTYTIALPRYAKGTFLAVTLYGYVDGERIEVSSFQCEDGEPKEKRFRERVNLTGGSGRPTIQLDDSGAACLTGQLGSGGFGVGIRNFLERLLGDGKQYVDVDDFGMEVIYKPDRHQLPALETVLRFPVARR